MKRLLIFAIGAILGMTLGYGIAESAKPSNANCPTEDSCSPSYENRKWVIVETPNDPIPDCFQPGTCAETTEPGYGELTDEDGQPGTSDS